MTPAAMSAGALFLMVAVIAVVATIGRFNAFYRWDLAQIGNRELPLDGLRGMAALLVMAHHAGMFYIWLSKDQWGKGPAFILLLGPAGVTIFFMLTGYLFWKKARTAKGKLNAWKLWRGRIFRIAPLYCFSLGFVLIIAFLKGHTVLVELKNWRQGARLLSLGALAWKPVGNADFGQYDAYVTWTLLWEWRFYALLPLLGSIAIGRRTYWLALLMYLISAVALWHYRVMPMWLTLGLTFVPGMICGVVLEDQQLRSRLSTPAAAVLALLAMSLIGLVIFFVAPIEWRNASLPGALLPVFAVSAAGNSFFGFLTQPAIRCLGTISYSLYLLHGIIYYVIVSFLKEMGFANLSGLSFWLIITAGAVGTAVLSAATYRWVEFPFIFRGHSLTAQKK